MKVLFLPILLFLASCLSDKVTPEGAIRSFVVEKFGQVVSRESVLESVTGKMKESFENMSDEDFEKFADLRDIEKDSFKVLSKSCQEKRCFLTYTVGYKTISNDKSVFVSEVKKIAEVVQVEGKWLIADVSNLKTYHESLEPINALE